MVDVNLAAGAAAMVCAAVAGAYVWKARGVARRGRAVAEEQLRKVQRYDSITLRMVMRRVRHRAGAGPFDLGEWDEQLFFSATLLELAMMIEYSTPPGREFSLLSPGATHDPGDPEGRPFSAGIPIEAGERYFDIIAKRAVAICGAAAANCNCGLTAGHDGAHICVEPSCGGSWTLDDAGEFVPVKLPGPWPL